MTYTRVFRQVFSRKSITMTTLIICSKMSQDYVCMNGTAICVAGTKGHLDAIREHGISKYHRKTFGICKKAKQHATL